MPLLQIKRWIEECYSNNNLVLLTIDSMENELIMLHRFAHAGESVCMKEPKIVVINSFGPLDLVVRLKNADTMFGYADTRDVLTPRRV